MAADAEKHSLLTPSDEPNVNHGGMFVDTRDTHRDDSADEFDTSKSEEANADEVDDGGNKERNSSSKHSGENSGSGHRRRHRHRRRQHNRRRWKPYNKLTSDEKLIYDDWMACRYSRMLEKRMQSGQPVAPFNTTQFLIEDRAALLPPPKLTDSPLEIHRQRSLSSSDESLDPGTSGGSLFERDFEQLYENVHAEYLESLSKNELVCECLNLEHLVSKLERQLRNERTRAGAGDRRVLQQTAPTFSATGAQLRSDNSGDLKRKPSASCTQTLSADREDKISESPKKSLKFSKEACVWPSQELSLSHLMGPSQSLEQSHEPPSLSQELSPNSPSMDLFLSQSHDSPLSQFLEPSLSQSQSPSHGTLSLSQSPSHGTLSLSQSQSHGTLSLSEELSQFSQPSQSQDPSSQTWPRKVDETEETPVNHNSKNTKTLDSSKDFEDAWLRSSSFPILHTSADIVDSSSRMSVDS